MRAGTKRTKIGGMTQPIEFRKPPASDDGLGQVSETWTDWAYVGESFGDFEELGGRELERARFKYDKANYSIEMFRTESFTPNNDMRIRLTTHWRTYTLDIGHIGESPNGSNRIMLFCAESV